ncbi:MAG: DUF1223 domain-containing protein [Rhizobiales bacterium]|nr:DUF1223 domain-containing protein [Hyphomicrobiales bacterium]
MRRPLWTGAILIGLASCGAIALAASAQVNDRTAVTAAVPIQTPAPASAIPRKSEPRAVLELFTSQGCSSCPPADNMVGSFSEDRSIIALSVPVDYWDYLGWKDTLASPRHTARQRGYAARRGDREVYTPQVVINGVAQALGSDQQAIEGGIALSHARPGTMTVPVSIAAQDDKFEITVTPRDESGNEGEVWLCALTRTVPVAIKRGENRGRTVTYHHVVRRWIRLGRWGGAGQNWTLAKSELDAGTADAVAVIVQAGNFENPGPIFGATMLALR